MDLVEPIAAAHNSELSSSTPSSDASAIAARIMQTGFCFIATDDELQSVLQSVFDAASRFFGAEIDEKLSGRLPLDAGYRPYGVEYSDLGELPDDVESFTFNPRIARPDRRKLSHAGGVLDACMQQAFDSLVPVFARTCTALARAFGASELEGRIEPSMREWSILQLNCARVQSDRRDFINACHEDGCLMTAMLSTGPGLELRLGDDTFQAVHPTPGKVLLPAGEILWLLTGGRIPPVFHRVRRVPGVQRRMSLLLFTDLGAPLCSPWRRDEVNRGVDIARKMLTNSMRFGLETWEPSDT